MPLCFHILMISHTYYRKYVKQVHCHTTPYTYYGKVGGDFYFHSWILANKWYHIYTMQQKKVKKAAVCLCILNLYISQNTFLFKTYLCNNVMEFYYFRLDCCAGYMYEKNESRCVSKYMHEHAMLFTNALNVMLAWRTMSWGSKYKWKNIMERSIVSSYCIYVIFLKRLGGI